MNRKEAFASLGELVVVRAAGDHYLVGRLVSVNVAHVIGCQETVTCHVYCCFLKENTEAPLKYVKLFEGFKGDEE